MAFTAVPIGPCWGIDCSAKLSPALAKQVLTTPLPNWQAIKFIFRYVSLSQPYYKVDIDAEERDAILACDVPLLLVQHVRYPGWIANAVNGTNQGNVAAEHAASVGYPAGAMLFVDLEGVGDVGGPVDEYVTTWAYAVQAVGFVPGLYQGYSCGIDPGTLAQHTEFGGFWSDFGDRKNPLNFVCKQYPQVMHCGIGVDPDQCYPDTLGRTLVGMKAS